MRPAAGVPAGLLAELVDVVGPSQVLRDPDVIASFATDWTGRFVGATAAVVRPSSAAEVAAVLSACRGHGVPLCLQGGNTGLVGGGVPLHGEVVLSLRRLGALGPVDPVAGQLTAAAGVSLAEVQAAARAAGWAYGVDMASRGSATIGGNVATNAGGSASCATATPVPSWWASRRCWAPATPSRTSAAFSKDNTGYHLPSLMCGSEGTLGVVTAVRLRLVPPAPARVVALLAFAAAAPAVVAAGALRRQLAALEAAELFFADGLDPSAG